MTALHDAELEAVGDGLDAGRSLPARWYADPATLEVEQELIFRRSWQYAGRADQVAEPGSYHHRAGRARPARRGARQGRRPARARQRLPPPRPPRAGGRRHAAPPSSAPTTPGPTTSTAGCARSPAARASRSASSGCCRASVAELGPFVFVHPEADAPPFADAIGELPDRARLVRRRARPARLPPPDPVDARARTGRSASRTTSSATTARSRIPGSRRRSTSPPTPTGSRPTHVLRAEGDAARPGRAAVDARRRDRARAVALPLAQRDAERRARARRTSPSTSGGRTAPAARRASRTTSSRPRCRRGSPRS